MKTRPFSCLRYNINEQWKCITKGVEDGTERKGNYGTGNKKI